MLVKNSYGCTIIPKARLVDPDLEGQFVGSALNRKKRQVSEPVTSTEEKTDSKHLEKVKDRSLSSRTKTKIRKKLYSFFGLYKKLTFLTLTFCNKVDDQLGVKILGKFLDNIKKQDKDFEFLWVAEHQTSNETFENNLHFHLISNKYWKIEKHWDYWLKLQRNHDILPRDESFKATSAFDVRGVSNKNSKGIGTYLTKYVTKNSSKFKCQVWNCSKKISRLYTDFYTNFSFVKFLESLELKKVIEIKRTTMEYCNVMAYPLNKTTLRLYDRLHEKNKQEWHSNPLNTN